MMKRIDALSRLFVVLFFAGFLSTIFSLTSTVFGEILKVSPDNYPTIQGAIDAAQSGDSIWVAAGRYAPPPFLSPSWDGYSSTCLELMEGISLKGGYDPVDWSRNITANPTIIDGQGSATAVIVVANDCLVEGFTITNAKYYGVLVNISGSAIIKNNTIIDNGKDGIKCINGFPHIKKNFIAVPRMGFWGDKVGGSTPGLRTEIVNNVFTNCEYGIRYSDTSDSAGSGIIWNNTFVHNGDEGVWGGAIYLPGFAKVSICNNIIAYNSVGISAGSSAGVFIAFNDVWGNTVGNYITLVGELGFISFVPLPGTGELSVNPEFVDFDSDYDGIDFDLRIQEGSYCVDRGTGQDAPFDDFENSPRPQGTGIDMGAFESPYTLVPIIPKVIYVDIDNDSEIEDGSQEYPYNTINEGVTSAYSGDTVRVMAGEYEGGFGVPSGVSLFGEDPDRTFIIGCGEFAPRDMPKGGMIIPAVVTLGGENTIISGFTITGDESGMETTFACVLVGSPVMEGTPGVIRNITIKNNIIAGGAQIGIVSFDVQNLRIINNTIVDFKIPGSEGPDVFAIGLASSEVSLSEITLKNNIIANNALGIWCMISSEEALEEPELPVISYNCSFGNVFGDYIYQVMVRASNLEGNRKSYFSRGESALDDYLIPFDPSPGQGEVSGDPLFVNGEELPFNLHLLPGSPCIDAGDPDLFYNDLDETRNDMGAYGWDRNVSPQPTPVPPITPTPTPRIITPTPTVTPEGYRTSTPTPKPPATPIPTSTPVDRFPVSGYIRNSTGAGISGVEVSFSGGNGGATTNSSGYYSKGGFSNGIWRLTPSRSHYTFSPSSRDVTIIGAAPSSQNFTGIYQTLPASVKGKLTNKIDGASISGASIRLGNYSATSSSSGRYLISGITPGSYTMKVSKSGFNDYQTSLTLSEGQAKTKNVKLTPKGAGVKPVISSLDPDYDCYFYLGGFDFNNTYRANVNWKEASPGQVNFNLNGSSSWVTAYSWGGKKTYNMGRDFNASFNSRNNQLKVSAKNNWGDISSSKILYPWVVPFPDWLARKLEGGGHLERKRNSWKLKGDAKFPDPPFQGRIDRVPDWVPFVGGHALGIMDTQARIAAELKSDGKGKLSLGGSTGFGAMGNYVWGNLDGTGYFNLKSSGLNLARADLELYLMGHIEKTFGILDCIPGLAGVDFPGKDWVNKHVKVTPEVDPEIDLRFWFRSKDRSPWLEFDRSTVTVGCGVKATLAINIYLGDLTVWGGGTPKITIQVPKNPKYIKKIQAVLNAGVLLRAWRYVLVDWEDSWYWYWTPKGEIGLTAKPTIRRGGVIPRTYLKDRGSYSRFVASDNRRSLEYFNELPLRESTAVLKLVNNVYPLCDPALVAREDELLVAYVYDDPTKEILQSTEIAYTRYNGSVWSDPQVIESNTSSEFNPQLALDGRGNYLAVWERVKDPEFNSPNMEAMAAEMEIVYSLLDSASGSWAVPLLLTDNDYLDYSPRLTVSRGGQVMATWISNEDNYLTPDSLHPSKIHYAIWDGLSWIESGVAVSELNSPAVPSAAYSTGGIVLAYSQDTDGDHSTGGDSEIYLCRYYSGEWGEPELYTDDSIADISPHLIQTSSGSAALLWRRGEEIVMTRNLENSSPEVVRDGSHTITTADFHLVKNNEGNLVMIWQNASEDGMDIFYIVYDEAMNTWGGDQSLVEDLNVEKSIAPIFDGNGDLVIAYNQVEMNLVEKEVEIEGEIYIAEGVPESGESDLYVLRHILESDMGIVKEDISIVGGEAIPGQTVTIEAIVRNLGDLVLSGVEVAFYDGDPDAGGEQIGLTQLIEETIEAGGTGVVSVEWTVPEGYTERLIYVRVDPRNLIAELNEDNNLACLGAILSDLYPEEVYSEYLPDGSMNLIATIANEGFVSAGYFTVELRKDTEEGELLASWNLSGLGSGEAEDLSTSMNLKASGLDDLVDVFIVVDSGDEIEESNEKNNTSFFQVYVDGDHDGMPDWWEIKHKLNRYDETDAGDDADEDGFSNEDEYRDGTDPNDPGSHMATPTPVPTSSPTPSPSPSTTPTPHSTPEYLVLASGDYDGDGISDIAIFRQDTGLWAVRGIGRVHFGMVGDIPVSGDYDGDGYTDIAVFRPSSGLWAVKGVTRIYYGNSDDISVPGDFDGDGTCDIALFGEKTGLWKVRNITRCYFGADGDRPVPGDYDGDGWVDIGVFRPTSGLWAIRTVTRLYFGADGDIPVPGTYQWYGVGKATGSFKIQPAIFRPATGLWAVWGYDRSYFGYAGDSPLLGAFDGSLLDTIAVFRPSSGLWAVKGVTRVYFGGVGDILGTR